MRLCRTSAGYATPDGRFIIRDMLPAYRSTHPSARVMGPRWRLTDTRGGRPTRTADTLAEVREIIFGILKNSG